MDAPTRQIVMRYSLRQIVFVVIVAGMLGLAAELLLLEHFDEWTQWIPLVLLGAGLLSAIAVARWPRPFTSAVFKWIMGAFVAAGVLGMYLHYAGNVEWEIERNSTLAGFHLFWKAVRGATPALAPAALAQIGLLGLAYVYSNVHRSATPPGAIE